MRTKMGKGVVFEYIIEKHAHPKKISSFPKNIIDLEVHMQKIGQIHNHTSKWQIAKQC